LGGNISYVGDPAYTERGICYSTSESPTISDTKVVVAGSGTGNFSTNITGLTVDNTYYVRAYATTEMTTIYGDQISFQTTASPPTLSTLAATDITSSSATLGGNISFVGDPAYTERGICYSTSVNPTINNTKIVILGSETGNFLTTITGLTPDNTYYVRAYATTELTTVYGNEISFRTEAPPPPTTAQVRFERAKAYTYASYLALIDNLTNENFLADHSFGTYDLLSPYYEIPSGNYIPVYYYSYPGSEGLYYFGTTGNPFTYIFQAGRQYTVLLDDDGTSFTISITNDGTFSAPPPIKPQTKMIKIPKGIINSQQKIIKEILNYHGKNRE